MTSEVLIFNKRGVVAAADSAVTSSGAGSDQRPRYAKTANKIFELSDCGNVAIAIFGGASVDAVPWELAIKLFRKFLGARRLPAVASYADELIAFLAANAQLFPAGVLDQFEADQFEASTVEILKWAIRLRPSLGDKDLPLEDRQRAWAEAEAEIRAQLLVSGVKAPLTEEGLTAALQQIPQRWVAVLAANAASAPELAAAFDAAQVAELAHRYRFAHPDLLLGYTGVVVLGYGEDEIFPGYRLVHLHGHVGRELFLSRDQSESITHTNNSLIVPLAQKSMIDLFTDGFGYSLWAIINDGGLACLQGLIDDLKVKGVVLDAIDVDGLVKARHEEFMKSWQRKNWQENYHPLMGVLTTLSIEEMAHLAETLLVLQSLKERVTSGSEEVGGPIDVAAITKSEGLVWIKRKHYFGAELNQRYLARLSRGMQS